MPIGFIVLGLCTIYFIFFITVKFKFIYIVALFCILISYFTPSININTLSINLLLLVSTLVLLILLVKNQSSKSINLSVCVSLVSAATYFLVCSINNNLIFAFNIYPVILVAFLSSLMFFDNIYSLFFYNILFFYFISFTHVFLERELKTISLINTDLFNILVIVTFFSLTMAVLFKLVLKRRNV